MEQKRVSIEVAKAIKKAGYPQGNTIKCYLTFDHNQFYKEGQIVENDDDGWSTLTKCLADIPTYLDVWRWLWRKKGIYIDITHYYSSNEVTIWDKKINKIKSIERMGKDSDPEEFIIAAIEYLVDNNLIK